MLQNAVLNFCIYGHRVAGAVLVVLGSDHRQFLGAVAMTLEIGIGDLAEKYRQSRPDLGFLGAVAGAQQHLADIGAGNGGHLFRAHDQRGRPPPAAVKSMAL